jgi:hypothetical protein
MSKLYAGLLDGEKNRAIGYNFAMHSEPLGRLSKERVVIILVAGLFLGLLVRIFPIAMTGFPLNDGGMFLSMIRDLKESHYLLPIVTSYNYQNFPYAYPPFGFYLAAILSDLFRIPDISILQWLPALVNFLCIPAFYWLAYEMLGDRARAALAAGFFAITPGSYGWLIMGGGLTRSLGALFYLLALVFVYQMFQSGTRRAIILSILFCALVVVSHPEVGLHTVAACALLWLFFGRSWAKSLKAMILVVGVIALTSPWWMTIFSRFGFAPIQSALQTGMYRTSQLAELWESIMAREGFIPVLTILRVAGIIYAVWTRRFFLISWMILPYVAEPRSAPALAIYPLSILIALGFADAWRAGVDILNRKTILRSELGFVENRFVFSTLLLILIYLFIQSSLDNFRLMGSSLNVAEREAMAWVQQNTPPDSHFILLTGVVNPEIDAFQEWFPVLAERRSQTTIQGFEWTLGSDFFHHYGYLADLQACSEERCINDWSARVMLDYDYLVAQKRGRNTELVENIKNSTDLNVIYETEAVLILERRVK